MQGYWYLFKAALRPTFNIVISFFNILFFWLSFFFSFTKSAFHVTSPLTHAWSRKFVLENLKSLQQIKYDLELLWWELEMTLSHTIWKLVFRALIIHQDVFKLFKIPRHDALKIPFLLHFLVRSLSFFKPLKHCNITYPVCNALDAHTRQHN